MTNAPDRRRFLSSAAASVLCAAVPPFGLVTPARKTDLLEIVGVDALVYPGLTNDKDDRVTDSHSRGPYIVVFGVGAAGMEAVGQLPSMWTEHLRLPNSCPPPPSVCEFVADAIASSRFPSHGYCRKERYSPLSTFDQWPMHLAIVCCSFCDESAFGDAARLAAALTSRTVPTVMVGRFPDQRAISGDKLGEPTDINFGSLRHFRLFRIIGPPPLPTADCTVYRQQEAFALASAASVFVNVVWSAGPSAGGLFDFYDQLFRAKQVPRGVSGETHGWPIIHGTKCTGHRADLPFRMDRWALLSHTVSKHRGMRHLRKMLIDCLRDRQWPNHRWSPVYVSIGSGPATTETAWSEMKWEFIEECDILGHGICPQREHIHSGEPARLSVDFLGVQVPLAEGVAVW